jgi:hypothetical protein
MTVGTAMYVVANGNVGIGTNAPVGYPNYTTLEVRNTGGGLLRLGNSATSAGYIYNDGNNMGMYNLTSTGLLDFGANGQLQMRITPSGNVGIGLTNPSYKLDVTGTFRATGYTHAGGLVAGANLVANDLTSTAALRIGNSGGDSLFIGQFANSHIWMQGAYFNSTLATYALILQPLGNGVTIGSNNVPQNSRLMVMGIGQTSNNISDSGYHDASIMIAAKDGYYGGGGALYFSTKNDNGTYLPVWAMKLFYTNGIANGVGDLVFSGRASGLATGTTERMRLNSDGVLGLTGGRIQFPATQVASTDANTLDDYEEGTWTPTLECSTTNPTLTYSLQAGRYTKIGNVVFLNFDLRWSSLTNIGSGNLWIGGLPFGSQSQYEAGVVSEKFGVSNPAGSYGVNVETFAGTSRLYLTGNRTDNGGSPAFGAGTLATGQSGYLIGAITYKI